MSIVSVCGHYHTEIEGVTYYVRCNVYQVNIDELDNDNDKVIPRITRKPSKLSEILKSSNKNVALNIRLGLINNPEVTKYKHLVSNYILDYQTPCDRDDIDILLQAGPKILSKILGQIIFVYNCKQLRQWFNYDGITVCLDETFNFDEELPDHICSIRVLRREHAEIILERVKSFGKLWIDSLFIDLIRSYHKITTLEICEKLTGIEYPEVVNNPNIKYLKCDSGIKSDFSTNETLLRYDSKVPCPEIQEVVNRNMKNFIEGRFRRVKPCY